MKVFFVAGGSYKAFYLNYYLNIKQCDLLIINFGVLYKLEASKDIEKSSVGKELLYLSNNLRCVVVAGLNINQKEIIAICRYGKIKLYLAHFGAKFSVKNKYFTAVGRFGKASFTNKIVLGISKTNVNLSSCSNNKIYMFFHASGVDFIENKKLQKKFNKYSKFILK